MWWTAIRRHWPRRSVSSAVRPAPITLPCWPTRRWTAVAIATPARTHFALARRRCDAGKHVLVEKPLTMDVGEAQTLIELAAARNLTLMVGHVFEYNPAVRYIRAAIDSGRVGRYLLSLQPARESWPRAERHQRALEHRAPRHFDCALRAERAARSGALPGVALS
jgi:predicted dehydrogenase